jgi:hypothetical protein
LADFCLTAIGRTRPGAARGAVSAHVHCAPHSGRSSSALACALGKKYRPPPARRMPRAAQKELPNRLLFSCSGTPFMDGKPGRRRAMRLERVLLNRCISVTQVYPQCCEPIPFRPARPDGRWSTTTLPTSSVSFSAHPTMFWNLRGRHYDVPIPGLATNFWFHSPRVVQDGGLHPATP